MKAIYVARGLEGNARLGRRSLLTVMSKPVITVSLASMLDDALQQMIKAGVRHLAVVDENGSCVGILSDRAIAAAWATDYDALARTAVGAALDGPPFRLAVTAVVVDAARMMRESGADAVVVVDDQDRPLGIVTGSDLVCLLAR